MIRGWSDWVGVWMGDQLLLKLIKNNFLLSILMFCYLLINFADLLLCLPKIGHPDSLASGNWQVLVRM